MKSLRVVLVAALTACACCKDTPRPTTCTGLALRQCADGDFCLLVEGSDAGTGRCHPAAGYSCDDSSIQRLCDAER
ncbi:MAG: hypothetical protein IT379_01835, partial [Deltaproteobacteria bacterium]|nr:hypothetical protein [Deltaproteobacteria bacterium]